MGPTPGCSSSTQGLAPASRPASRVVLRFHVHAPRLHDRARSHLYVRLASGCRRHHPRAAAHHGGCEQSVGAQGDNYRIGSHGDPSARHLHMWQRGKAVDRNHGANQNARVQRTLGAPAVRTPVVEVLDCSLPTEGGAHKAGCAAGPVRSC